MYQFLYPSSYRRTSWLFSSFGNYEESCINIHVQVLCAHKFSAPLGKYQGVQLQNYMLRICFVLQSGWISLHFHQWMRAPVSPRPCQPPVLSVFQTWAILMGGWWVVSHCCLGLHFLDDIRCRRSFYVLTYHLYIFCLLFQLGCSCSYCRASRNLCILWVTFLYRICGLQIFSSSLWLIFSLSWWVKFFIIKTITL